MKLIYITGPTSVGKTTLAKEMLKNASILSLDALSKCIRFTFDDFKLYTDEISIRPNVNNDKLLQIVKKYIDLFNNDYPDKALIVEGCHFPPNEFLAAFPNAQVIAIGITNYQVALKQINTKDWIKALDDDTKQEFVNKIVSYSKELKQNQRNYKYIEFERKKYDE